MSLSVVVLLLASVLTFVLTGWMTVHARARRILDVPNERSSHTVPTPRGGGVGIVASFAGGVIVLALGGSLGGREAAAYAGAAGLVAAVGMLDDVCKVSVSWRLIVHFVAVGLGLVLLGELLPPFASWWPLAPLLVVGLVWFLNLYNFMDGIDGLATAEAITVCLGMAALASLEGRFDLALVPALLAFAALGFLPWNAPPAKIFMGDVGSGFIGCVLGFMIVHLAAAEPSLLAACLILPAVFVADASVTLLRRMLAGRAIHQAHRSHAYQHASRRLGSHGLVTAAVSVINLAWLFPVAVWVVLGEGGAWLGIALAYLPLIAMAWRLDAGRDA